MPTTDKSNPTTTLAATYPVAGSHSPPSSIFAVSHPKLENVVYPPKNPTVMAIRQSGETIMRFNVICPTRPRRKHPVRLISSVPQGNVLPVCTCVNTWML